jgi:hypothetical protein
MCSISQQYDDVMRHVILICRNCLRKKKKKNLERFHQRVVKHEPFVRSKGKTLLILKKKKKRCLPAV